MKRRILLPLAVGVACLAACAGDPPAPEPEPETGEAVEQPAREALASGERALVRYAPVPDPIPLNTHFELSVEVMDAQAPDRPLEGVDVFVSGWMPAHLHGMPTDPVTEERGGGLYDVKGMLFQMPGHWQIHVDVVQDGIASRATFDVHL